MAALIQSARRPVNGPSWDEEVVPALRKRLESESRTLDRRMSAVSLSSQDDPHGPSFSMLSEANMREAYAPNSPFLQSNAAGRSRAIFPESRTSLDRIIPPSSSRTNGTNTPSKKKPPSSSSQRPRTYSQPYLADLPNGKISGGHRQKSSGNGKPPMPDVSRALSPRPIDVKPTRIPKASRGPPGNSSNHGYSSPNGNGFQYTSPDLYQSPDLQVVHETPSMNSSRSNVAIPNRQNPGLLNEPAPFQPGSASSVTPSHLGPEEHDEAPPRPSNDSEERPFEHWYRGEVSRNGGVGELRVGRRQEMLEIANYGHSIRSQALGSRAVTPIVIDDGRIRRKRADSVSGVEAKARERDSLYLDEDDAQQIGRVLDESPLTDLDGEVDGSDIGSASEHYSSVQHSYNYNTGAGDLSTVSAPVPQTVYDNRSTTPTPSTMQRPSSRQQNAPATRIPGPSRPSVDSYVSTPTSIVRGSSEPPSMQSASTSTSTPPTRQRQQSKPTPASGKRGASPSATPVAKKSRTAASQATRAKTLASKKEIDDEAKRRSVAYYPAPADGDEMMEDAIPSWTQPVPREGNWDDVVLPVVARKKGLDGHYEKADGNPTPRKANTTVEPAPGTFGYDHSKYRPPRGGPEFIPMDEFGRPSTRIAEEREQGDHNAPASSQFPLSSHDQTRLPVRQPPPPSPAPFSDYAPTSEKQHVGIITGSGKDQTEQMAIDAEDEKGGGCCKCVIM